jgi:hypothetical protein
MDLKDFKPGDRLIITERTTRGEERRAAEVACVNYKGNGLVTYAGVYDNPERLLPTGQGAFNPAEVGTKPFGFHIKVEKVGHQEPWKPADTGFLYGNPGYDLMHDAPKRGR